MTATKDILYHLGKPVEKGQTIWKFSLGDKMCGSFELPMGAVILCVDAQGVDTCLWALVDPEQPTETRKFRIFGTGQLIDEGSVYVGTFQSGPFVWHVFEVVA